MDDSGNIWLSGIEDGCSLLKINPDAKTMEKAGPERIVVLARGGDRFFYATVPDDDPEAPPEKKDLEVGVFDPASGKFEPLWNFAPVVKSVEDAKKRGFTVAEWAKHGPLKTIRPCIAAAPDGSACCVPAEFKNGKQGLFFIRVVEHALKFGKEDDPARLSSSVRWVGLDGALARAGGAAFTAGSQTVWVAGLVKKEGGGGDAYRIALAHVHPVEGVQQLKALPFDDSIEIDDDMTIGLQPAISPDGRRLAVGTYPYKQTAACPLAVVDLQSEDLDCHIVAAPESAAGEAGKKDG
jgi:hypothetical protein